MTYESGAEHSGKYVAYYRVSTDKQGQSGLGLEAQQKAVAPHLRDGELIGAFTEVESGKKDNRPQLNAALDMCRGFGATLVIAKLDRLARNVEFTARMMNSNIEFIAADMPDANRLTVHIMAAMAEHEREMTSVRTKAALQVLKDRGIKLGAPAASLKSAGAKGNVAKQATAKAYANDEVLPVIDELKTVGLMTLREIAGGLEKRGVKTPSGKSKWHPQGVANVLKLA